MVHFYKTKEYKKKNKTLLYCVAALLMDIALDFNNNKSRAINTQLNKFFINSRYYYDIVYMGDVRFGNGLSKHWCYSIVLSDVVGVIVWELSEELYQNEKDHKAVSFIKKKKLS